jgi:hypothetical protein
MVVAVMGFVLHTRALCSIAFSVVAMIQVVPGSFDYICDGTRYGVRHCCLGFSVDPLSNAGTQDPFNMTMAITGGNCDLAGTGPILLRTLVAGSGKACVSFALMDLMTLSNVRSHLAEVKRRLQTITSRAALP